MAKAIFNPNNADVSTLPTIYGFPNGLFGMGDLVGQLIAEDGVPLGSHVCSSEGYMLHDLGIDEGSRPDRHETFQKHYPNGYRMEFVSGSDVKLHEGLQRAFAAYDAAVAAQETSAKASAQ